jgi:hypothetical protein
MFVAFGGHYALRTRIMSSVACPNAQHKRHEFREKERVLNTKYVLSFSVQTLSGTFLILRRIQRDLIPNAHRSSCKVPAVIAVRF